MSSHFVSKSSRTCLVLSLLSALGLAGCSANPAQKTAAESGAEPPAAAEQPAAATAEAASAEPGGRASGWEPPPGAEVFTDETGRKYYLDKYVKVEGRYRRTEDGMVRVPGGYSFYVVKEDDDYFYFKVMAPVEGEEPVLLLSKPTAAQLAAAAKAYAVSTPESDRVRLEPFDQGLPIEGQWRNGFELADMNGDGKLDIVHCPPRKSLGPPVIFLGNGRGQWRRWTEATFPKLRYDYGDVKVADFNNDGNLDLVLAVHLHGLIALLGDGKGGFTDASQGLDFRSPGDGGATAFTSRALATLDWNGDGFVDVVALGEGPGMSSRMPAASGGRRHASASYGLVIYLNQGDGTWTKQEGGASEDLVFGEAVATGDFDGDGRRDIATGTSVMGSDRLVNLARPDGSWEPVPVEGVRPRSSVRSVAAADFDRDGRDDLALGYVAQELGVYRTGIDILYSRPEGRWERRALAAQEDREAVNALGVGDLNADGALDLVALSGAGRTWVFTGDGQGFFRREKAEVPQYEGACSGYQVELADLDGDGADEVVANFAGEPSQLFAPELCTSRGGLKVWDPVVGRERRRAAQ